MARGTSDGKLVSSPKPPKPSVRVTEDDLPEIKNWTVGKKYKVTATVEMRGHNKGDRYGFDEGAGKKKHEADLVIHKIASSDGSDASPDTQ